ncbi:MAG: response regulator [Dehalococcoidia bacterium]
MSFGGDTIAKNILIVDDEAGYTRAVKYALEKEGYNVITASNGLQGLMTAQKEQIDLLILDVMLPGLDGYEVCNRLRSDPSTSNMPIIMLSAKGQDADRTTGLQVGASEYISKPVDNTTLLSKISSWLSKS